MQDMTKRRSSLRLAMALIAATAPGLALTRSQPEYLGVHETITLNYMIGTNSASGWTLRSPGLSFTPAGQPLNHRPSYWLSHIPYWAAPCLLSLSVATLALGVRSRLPCSHPGLTAGLAVLVALAVHAIRCLQYVTVNGQIFNNLVHYMDAFMGVFWVSLPRLAGYTVAVWWLALGVSGSRSADSGATGRLGRSLGWCWIAMGVASEIAVWCYPLNY